MAKAKKDPKKKAAAQKAPAKKAAPKAKAAKPAPKAQASAKKPVKTAKAPAAKVAKVEADKKSPKTVAKAEVAPRKKLDTKVDKKADKKAKKDDLGFDDYEDNFDDEVAQYEDLKTKTPEQMEELRALLGETDTEEVEIALRDAEGRLYCKMRECDELSIVDGYCRFHYLKLWKKIQLRKKILTDGKLEKYIEELTLRYPDKYIEMIREDLKSEKHFLAAIQELEIEDVDVDQNENEEDQGLMDEVRGLQTAGDGDDDSF